MSDAIKAELDRVLTENISTPTPYLHPNGWQSGRNFLFLNPLEREEVIKRVDKVLRSCNSQVG
jgi:hypothetical protein